MNAFGLRTVGVRDRNTRRIRVSEPVRLRDCFRRLGARAEIVDDGVVAVELPDHYDLSLDEYLASWSAINGIDAIIEPAPPLATAAVVSLLPERRRLGDLLIDRGLITEERLAEGLAESRSSGELLGRVLLRHRWLFEDELARMLAMQLDLPYVSLRVTGFDRSVARLLPSAIGLQVAAIPIGIFRDRIRVAFADPTDENAVATVNQHLSQPEAVVAELSDIESAWRTLEH
jgi:hypothetical protein